MVTRAMATLGTGDEWEAPARAAMARLDALVVDGEPIVSVFRDHDAAPWHIDVLFTDDAVDPHRWLEEAARLVPALSAPTFDDLAERDWVAESQRALHPVQAGRFIIHGSHDTARMTASRWRLVIDAGRAFGTAHHESTVGCLLALESRAKRAPLGRVADVGTGTGVLALAAERLGARRIVAGDIDPQAVRVARENVRQNRTVRPIATLVAAGPVGEADVVIANILARPLIAMAGSLAASTRDTLILSGLRRRDVRRVAAAYRARGLVRHSARVLGDWVTLTLVRPRRPHAAMRSERAKRGRVLPAPRFQHAIQPEW